MKNFDNKNLGALNTINMRRTSNKVVYWGMFAILLVVALICLLPPLWILISSFKTPRELMQIPPAIFPEKFSFEKFGDIWKLLHFEKFYINTIIIAVGSVISAVVLNGLAGYVISCLKPRGSVAVLTAIIWTMLLPNTLSMVPLFKNMIQLPVLGFNLSNTYWPMWMCAGANAFNILLFKDAFDSLPISLVEAARLDGCGRMGVFGRIILPLSKPIMAVVSIFTVTSAWGDFLLPYLILTDRNKQTVMLQIYNLQTSSYSSPADQTLVAIVFAIIPPIIIFFFFQKFIMGGATVGGVKE